MSSNIEDDAVPNFYLSLSQVDHDLAEEMKKEAEEKKKKEVPKAKGSSSLRVLSGGVSRVKSWTQYLHNLQSQSASGSLPPVMFRVYGILTSITPGANSSKMISSKLLVISDLRDSTQSLRCVFHEIDRNLDPMKIGDCVAVAGRRISNREDVEMQIVSVETFALEEVEPYLNRMENFANRALKSIT